MGQHKMCEPACEKPFPESPAERPEGHDPVTGRFTRGNQARLTHGAYARGHRPPELLARLGDLDAFRASLEADQGGREELTTIRNGYITRIVEVEALCRLLGADIVERGIFTKRGRTRSTFSAFLQAVEKWDKLAHRLGLDRRERDVLDLTAAEWIQQQTDDDEHESPDADRPDGSTT